MSTFCSYQRTNADGKESVLTLTVLPPEIGLARSKALFKTEGNVTIHGTLAIWYRTPSHLIGGERGGTMSAIDHRLLVLIAIRGVVKPKTGAERAMSHVLTRM